MLQTRLFKLGASVLAIIAITFGVLVVQASPATAAIGDIVNLSTSAPVSGAKLWRSVYSNSGGDTLYAVPQGGQIYKSTNYGSTWAALTGAGTHQWNDISVSADGTKLAAADGNVVGGYIYTSSDSGATWTQQTGSGLHYWHSVNLSADGTKLVATYSPIPALGAGYIATSSDSGVTWTDQTVVGNQNWYDATLSADGTKIAAVAYGGDIWTSTDFGANWSDRSAAGTRTWYHVSASSDGTKLAAAASNGSVYVSLDSGATWTAKTIGTPTHLMVATYSADGSMLLAGDYPGDLYSSTDDGATWTDQTTAGSMKWYSLAMNATGTRMIAGIYNFPFGGDIWGTAVPTGPAFSSSTLSIPDTNVGSTSVSQTLTITNTGAADLTFSAAATLSGANLGDYSIVSDQCYANSPIAASGTCTVTLTFTPSASGTRTASLVFTDNATGNPHSVSLSGTGLAPTFSAVAPTIPNTTVGSASVTQTVTVTNTGNANLTFSAAATKSGTNPGDFVVIADNCFANSPIAPSGTCTLTFTFNPTAGGSRTANLVFTDNAPSSPHTVALTATAIAPVFSAVAPTIPDTNVGSTATTQTVTVTNTGNADLVYGASAVALSGTNAADFAITTDNCSSLSVLSSANCTVVLSFTPSAIGTRTANLVFTDNASGSPHSVALTGVGLGAAISTTVTPIPATQVGNTSALQTLTVTNSGNANLIFGALAAVLGGANAADYTIVTDGCSNQTIAPAATCTITFTYNPKQAGTSAASIDLTSNAIGSPTSVTLSGVATSGISQPLDVTAPPKTPAANDVTVTPGNGLLTVGINFHDFITYEPGSYVVTASPSGNSCVISSPSGTCTIMGLTPGVDYTISIVATNVFGSSGAYTSARTWQPLGASALRVAARLKLIDFKGDSPVLLAKLRAKVKKFVKAHPSLTNFTCVGFTAGQHVLKTDHALARARATNVCGFLATLKPASIETIIGRTPGLPFGGQYRRVVVTGWGTIK